MSLVGRGGSGLGYDVDSRLSNQDARRCSLWRGRFISRRNTCTVRETRRDERDIKGRSEEEENGKKACSIHLLPRRPVAQHVYPHQRGFHMSFQWKVNILALRRERERESLGIYTVFCFLFSLEFLYYYDGRCY